MPRIVESSKSAQITPCVQIGLPSYGEWNPLPWISQIEVSARESIPGGYGAMEAGIEHHDNGLVSGVRIIRSNYRLWNNLRLLKTNI
jgi:hypothetical protein